MREDLAAVNVTRSYTLAGTNLAIFTFMLFFLYPEIRERQNQSLVVSVHIDRYGYSGVLTRVRDVALLPVFACRRVE